MPMLKLTVGQVIELVKQLPQEDKYAVLHAINPDIDARMEDKLEREKEQQLRAVSAKRGLDWDKLSEDDQEVIAKNLLQKSM
ncbi:MAG: hypothetical protein KME25_09990 [Symplocastrum torsivum CPER-KK1]|jgi:hypothetical protein|uniref:Uncharacterized protein n=1 Tax=Symplocastrum torsivum CPER-KK1 TaxID=450513 RepID=A0A951U9D2_9CYAN|nr:hypothetical protein [Microcoleus sp. FACHB-SPT15]MBD1807388.1 hypothetical protein [Microcoleus sp. FACHB-SPT15]MBW4544755.1 hypothetical protein [Symplocastrum torsivum CPER-KK1]